MPKSKWRKPKQQNKQTPPSTHQKKPIKWWTPFRKMCAGLIGGIFAIVGALSGSATFFPRLTVQAMGDAYTPASNSPAIFRVTNTGIVPLYNVHAAIGMGAISNSPGRLEQKCIEISPTYLAPKQWKIGNLLQDQNSDVAIEDAMKFTIPIDAANISIRVYFDAWFIPILRHKDFNFFLQTMSDGKNHWRSCV